MERYLWGSTEAFDSLATTHALYHYTIHTSPKNTFIILAVLSERGFAFLEGSIRQE